MSATHTPGPWHRNIKPASRYPTVFAGRNTHVCVVTTRGLPDDEIEANIQLIAAAPDLLAALRDMIEPHERGWKVTDWDIRCDAARAAIARATPSAT
jgi:hypothetical protein